MPCNTMQSHAIPCNDMEFNVMQFNSDDDIDNEIDEKTMLCDANSLPSSQLKEKEKKEREKER